MEVGDPVQDHQCWIRPENMKTPRTVLSIDQNHPGTEIAAETSAALAASSIVFQYVDHDYSHSLLNRAKLVRFHHIPTLSGLFFHFIKITLLSIFSSLFGSQLFEFAKSHKGTYDGECPFYCSNSGYNVLSRSLLA